jgi:hypothetical protein
MGKGRRNKVLKLTHANTASIYLTTPSIRFFFKMVWPKRTRKRKDAGSPISDMNENTV